MCLSMCENIKFMVIPLLSCHEYLYFNFDKDGLENPSRILQWKFICRTLLSVSRRDIAGHNRFGEFLTDHAIFGPHPLVRYLIDYATKG